MCAAAVSVMIKGNDIMKNVVLIGMPGAGKSTVGVVLAKILGYDFLDSDLLIQKQEKKILQDLIEEKGIDGFLSIENQVNRDIRVSHTVISTGGSICYCDEAMKKLSEGGLIVYIQTSYKTLRRRLGNLSKRGVVIREGSTLRDLYNERAPLYEKYAHLTINADGLTIEQTIEKISSQVEKALS